jgi:uncharacterized protein
MNREELLNKIKNAIYAIEPGARIILYGSQSRREAGAESDWDFLILIDGVVDEERINRIRHTLYEIEWDSDEIISSIIENYNEWNSYPCISTPFYENVTREGILI